MKNVIENMISSEIFKYKLKEKMTGYLVKKKRRGTYQALEESTEIEKVILENVVQYIDNWLLHEITVGKLHKEIKEQVNSQVRIELYEKGFIKLDI